jgi:hypothetical protein
MWDMHDRTTPWEGIHVRDAKRQNAEESSLYGKRKPGNFSQYFQKSRNPCTERRVPRLETLRLDRMKDLINTTKEKGCSRPRYQDS